MGDNELEYEYEIDLKDLCVSVLKKWRFILLAAVAGAVLLGGLRVLINLTSAPELVMSSSELTEAETEIADAEKAITTAETEITRLEGEITKAETTIEANEKSIANIDDRVALAESQLENLNKFLDNYSAALEKLMESEEMDADLADRMTDYLVQIDTIQTSILSKETEIMDLYDSGPELEEANEDLAEAIEDYEEQIAEQESLIEEQEELIADLEVQMAQVTSVSLTNKIVTFIILGAFVGICLICAYAFLQYCFDKTIHMEEDFSKYTGLHVLSSIDLAEKDSGKKKNVIDRLIDKFAGINPEADHTSATQCAIAAAKIQVLTGNKKVLVTGTVDGDRIEKVCAGLRESLPQGEYEVLSAENPMYHSEEILRMGEYGIVLVEAPHITKVKELLSLTGFLRLSDVNVIGIVSTEG
ncbi:MAG: hypothetical protein LUE16_06380 [Lachnospiraceae bacterium]|nr:hypothetical protein [Lachnospiraceae bacterium]